ncbi:MAG: hypothetical protein NC310_04480 [Roseburia sp.]|nr:hypothetical protein [Anaeroplasma bactoclasticum]MCM1196318.1 hypothetical protein [Roseburia sp.]
MRIESKQGLKKLKKRFQEVEPKKVEDENCTSEERCAWYWIKVIDYAIKENLSMDEIDYKNTPKAYRKLWKGLR